MEGGGGKLILSTCRLDSSDVAFRPQNPKIVGLIPSGVDRFSGCENRKDMVIWHVKVPLNINLALIL
ncbi:hypothetical protein TNCV_2300941 [Trichonephila clavipes]|nr:hypothetical protein TNCV_2300941 [Trichonephila clavipes]